jgi:hypothetical protein
MARKSHYRDALFKNPGVAFIHGRFKTVNDANPTETEGNGWTVARTAEGKWTLTLSETYLALISATGSAMLASAAADAGDLVVHFAPIEENTACSSVVVYLSQDGTDSDVPGAWVNFQLVLRDTNATK